ncbi:hypothetical protein [Celeribacter marinus]|uniref:hypothetical protein n=1 Tax=Celeribacter marinus TaxID=1397108 RepID=UPI00316E0EC2
MNLLVNRLLNRYGPSLKGEQNAMRPNMSLETVRKPHVIPVVTAHTKILFIGFPTGSIFPRSNAMPLGYQIASCDLERARDLFAVMAFDYVCLYSDSMSPHLIDHVRDTAKALEETPQTQLIAVGSHFPNEFKSFLIALGAHDAIQWRGDTSALLSALHHRIQEAVE